MQPRDPETQWPAPLGVIGAWQTTVVVGVVTVILGLIVSFHPTVALNVVAILLGLLMVISGLFHLSRMFSSAESHRAWLAISGLLLIVLGVLLIRHLHLTVAIIGLIIGISWIAQGLSALAGGTVADSGAGRGWWIFFGTISLIGGIVITAVPVASVTALAILVGVWFIVEGLLEIVGGFLLRQMISQSQVTILDPSRAGQGAAWRSS